MKQQVFSEEFSHPIDISDIIAICKEYNQLGYSLQMQIDAILDLGVEDAINNSKVNENTLPFIKRFLKCIVDNQLFGDASSQAFDCIQLINNFYEDKQKKEWN